MGLNVTDPNRKMYCPSSEWIDKHTTKWGQIRNSLKYVSWKDIKAVTKDLIPDYAIDIKKHPKI